MNFEKFVKSLGSDGIIYNQGGDQWLASATVFMRIPEGINSVVAQDIADMPTHAKDILFQDISNAPCLLVRAVMPFPSGGIKDCIRIFATSDGHSNVSLPICHNDYALIQKGDIVEIHAPYNGETGEYEGKALIVSTKPKTVDDEPQIVGIIFPVNYEV